MEEAVACVAKKKKFPETLIPYHFSIHKQPLSSIIFMGVHCLFGKYANSIMNIVCYIMFHCKNGIMMSPNYIWDQGRVVECKSEHRSEDVWISRAASRLYGLTEVVHSCWKKINSIDKILLIYFDIIFPLFIWKKFC